MIIDLTNPIFTDVNKARKHLEGILWPDGPVCPHCGVVDEATKLMGKVPVPASTSAVRAPSPSQ